MRQRAHMPEPVAAVADQHIVLSGIAWDQYEAMRAATDHIHGLRLTYLEGTLEIMSPSSRHGLIKTLIARLVEVYAEEQDLQLTGFGSTTYKNAAMERALEPDECYVLGEGRETPDLAIEVVLTSGGVDKLEVYRGLSVREVWFWVDGRGLELFALDADRAGYARIERSVILPDLDVAELAGIVATARPFDQTRAARQYRARLAARAKP